jgi:ubiquinone biosynthesis protein UbiJ
MNKKLVRLLETFELRQQEVNSVVNLIIANLKKEEMRQIKIENATEINSYLKEYEYDDLKVIEKSYENLEKRLAKLEEKLKVLESSNKSALSLPKFN